MSMPDSTSTRPLRRCRRRRPDPTPRLRPRCRSTGTTSLRRTDPNPSGLRCRSTGVNSRPRPGPKLTTPQCRSTRPSSPPRPGPKPAAPQCRLVTPNHPHRPGPLPRDLPCRSATTNSLRTPRESKTRRRGRSSIRIRASIPVLRRCRRAHRRPMATPRSPYPSSGTTSHHRPGPKPLGPRCRSTGTTSRHPTGPPRRRSIPARRRAILHRRDARARPLPISPTPNAPPSPPPRPADGPTRTNAAEDLVRRNRRDHTRPRLMLVRRNRRRLNALRCNAIRPRRIRPAITLQMRLRLSGSSPGRSRLPAWFRAAAGAAGSTS